MKLPPDVLQKIVLAMFATRGLGQGDLVWLSRFEEFWAQKTQLRRSDLLDALAEVCSNDWMVIEEHEGRSALALTPKGDLLAKTIVSRGLTDVHRYARDHVLSGMRFRDSLPNTRGLGRRWHEAPEAVRV
ncbi:MAG TPA: hypothetical protein VJM11_01160 [Nevskiaceae bacterium]|nr:hypothetical protein [Nevskiaceae bacterium]